MRIRLTRSARESPDCRALRGQDVPLTRAAQRDKVVLSRW